jgi:Tfp pilus assembly protein PilP
MAGDPMIEKQRQFQKQRFDLFNGLSRRFNDDEETKMMASPSTMPQNPVAFIDSIAFPKGNRDPFAIPSILLQSLANERSEKERKLSASAFAFSNSSLHSVPTIKLKGVVHHPGNPSPLAIVHLNNETYMVREGDEVGFNPAEPSQIIKIKKINRLSVLVEVGTLGALVIVR